MKLSKKVRTILKDKVVVVFGGSDGIGKSIVDLLRTECGSEVYSFSRSENGIDVTVKSDILRALDSVGKPIDHIVTTPGYLLVKPFMELSEDDIEYSIEANYLSVLSVSQIGYKFLEKRGGSILVFGSTSAFTPRRNYCVYSSLKSAVIAFAEGLGKEWEGTGVRINCIVPRRTNTKMRFEAFGPEDPKTLLDPGEVARVSAIVLAGNDSGQMFLVPLP